MSNVKLVLLMFLTVCTSFIYADFTEIKKIALVQKQLNSEVVFVWAEGNESWFGSGNACSSKNQIVQILPKSQSESDVRAFEQLYAQLLLAQATGLRLRFGNLSETCDANSVYYRADYVQVFTSWYSSN